jgi:hypothetical protein
MDQPDTDGQQQKASRDKDDLRVGRNVDKPESKDTDPKEQPQQPDGKFRKAVDALKRHGAEFWEKTPPHDKLNTLLTFVIASATVVYVIVSSDTLTEIKNGKADTSRIITASETQARAADSFSKAADRIDVKIAASEKDFRRMASASEQSLRTVSQTDQRAWVGVTGIKGITMPPAPEALNKSLSEQGYFDLPYSFTIENSGKTPARYMKVRSTYSIGIEPLPWPNPGRVEDEGFFQVIFPGKTEEDYSTHPVRLSFIDGLRWQLGREYVFVYIVIEYNDIFPNTKLRHTWVCSKFGPHGEQTFCHSGNDAD